MFIWGNGSICIYGLVLSIPDHNVGLIQNHHLDHYFPYYSCQAAIALSVGLFLNIIMDIFLALLLFCCEIKR